LNINAELTLSRIDAKPMPRVDAPLPSHVPLTSAA
jgi:hypothetical protein